MTKVYAFTEAADDVMLIGIVNWEFDNGKKYEQEFVARFLIEGPHSAKPTMKLYQGWAVSLVFMTNLTALILDTMLIYNVRLGFVRNAGHYATINSVVSIRRSP